MTSLEQGKFTFNCLLQDMKESWCCVFKVRQYIVTFYEMMVILGFENQEGFLIKSEYFA